MTKLYKLVDIRSGYTFRRGIDRLPAGDTEVYQAGDLSFDIDFSTKPRIAFSGKNEHYLLEGDILISAKGFPKAYIYHSSRKAVASSSVLVLRSLSDGVLPEYITAFFNSKAGLKAYLRLASSDSLNTITKSNLGEIDIPDIPIEIQRSLGKLVDSIDTMQRQIAKKGIYLDRIRTVTVTRVLKEYT